MEAGRSPTPALPDRNPMTARPVAFDLTRLITRVRHASPTGIDRVDLAYARWIFGGAGARFGVVSTPFGPRVLDGPEAVAVVEAVAAGWTEDVAAEDDPVWLDLANRLGMGAVTAGKPRPAGGRRTGRTRLEAAMRLQASRGAGPQRLPSGTLYLHTSHLRLDRPERFDWLYDRRDVRPVFFVHDLIPISHPEYGRAGEAARHRVRMLTMARHAAHIIANSADVATRFAEHVAADGFARPAVTVAPLGVEPAFAPPAIGGPSFPRPTFVVCGTIEPRKNHWILLNLWRRLSERLGSATPDLVLVGRRGWDIQNVANLLDRCPAMPGHVHEVGGLTTPGLVRLMQCATALLMPSFIEGYGLPLVEAAACGLPVVASDIAVHREVAGRFAHFVDPLDGPGWSKAVTELGAPHSPLRARLIDRSSTYEPPTWGAHFARVANALAAIA